MSFPNLFITDGSTIILHSSSSSSSSSAAEDPKCQCSNNNHPTLFPIGCFNGGGNGTSAVSTCCWFLFILSEWCHMDIDATGTRRNFYWGIKAAEKIL
jgi:hypothetical protein